MVALVKGENAEMLTEDVSAQRVPVTTCSEKAVQDDKWKTVSVRLVV